MWKCLQSISKESIGILSINSGRVFLIDDTDKASSFNRQVCFTHFWYSNVPCIPDNVFEPMLELVVTHDGTLKLLDKMKASSANGPDSIPSYMVKACSNIIGHYLL